MTLHINRFLALVLTCLFVLDIDASMMPDNQAEAPETEICFSAKEAEGTETVAKVLNQKIHTIIGRIGCGCEDAQYLIVPVLEVTDVKHTSGTLRSVTSARGELILEAVSASDPEMVWHSVTIPLKCIVERGEDPAEALAKQIKVTDSAFVRFIRIAKQKIAGKISAP